MSTHFLLAILLLVHTVYEMARGRSFGLLHSVALYLALTALL